MAIPVRFGHESLEVGLACFKDKDAESERSEVRQQRQPRALRNAANSTQKLTDGKSLTDRARFYGSRL